MRASEGSLPHSHGPSWCHSCIADDRRGDMVTAVRAIRSSCTHGGAAGLPGLTQAEHRPLASPDCKRPDASRGVGCPAGLDGSEALAHQAFGDRLHLPVEAAHTHDGRPNARALAALADHSEAVTLIEGALRAAGQSRTSKVSPGEGARAARAVRPSSVGRRTATSFSCATSSISSR